MTEYFEIGVIANTHGLRGDLRVFPTTDDRRRFDLLKTALIEQGAERFELEIQRVWYHKQFVMLKLAGIDDVDAAARLKGARVLIHRRDALPLAEDEYYLADLLGLRAITVDGEVLGEVADVLFTGANDVYVVKNDKGGQILLPAIKKCLLKIDIEKGEILVNLLEGLR